MSLKLYKKITFNPQNKKRIIKILDNPRINSKVIGYIVDGNVIEIYEIHKLNWTKIKCNNFIGFIKIEFGADSQISNDNTMYIAKKDNDVIDNQSRDFLDDIIIVPRKI